MADTKDTLLRLITLLQLIPRAPARVSTPVLLEKLKDKGFVITQRSLQRDLESLELHFALVRVVEGKTYHWSFHRDAANLNLPKLDTPTALALHLAESHLHHLLPQGVMQQLSHQFRAAQSHLDSLANNLLALWPQRVRAIPAGQALQPAKIDPQVWAAASEALVQQKQLQVSYLSRSKSGHKTLTLHPQNLVSRHTVNYLVAMADDYEDLRHFALHRIEQAQVLDAPARARSGHDIDSYIAGGAFATPRSGETVELVADIDPQTAWLLHEAPLSRQQSITPLRAGEGPQDWQRLSARLPDSQETIWWILGLNSRIRVHAPAHWVDEIRRQLGAMQKLYE